MGPINVGAVQTTQPQQDPMLQQLVARVEAIELTVSRLEHECTTSLATMASRLDKSEAEIEYMTVQWTNYYEQQENAQQTNEEEDEFWNNVMEGGHQQQPDVTPAALSSLSQPQGAPQQLSP